MSNVEIIIVCTNSVNFYHVFGKQWYSQVVMKAFVKPSTCQRAGQKAFSHSFPGAQHGVGHYPCVPAKSSPTLMMAPVIMMMMINLLLDKSHASQLLVCESWYLRVPGQVPYSPLSDDLIHNNITLILFVFMKQHNLQSLGQRLPLAGHGS